MGRQDPQGHDDVCTEFHYQVESDTTFDVKLTQVLTQDSIKSSKITKKHQWNGEVALFLV